MAKSKYVANILFVCFTSNIEEAIVIRLKASAAVSASLDNKEMRGKITDLDRIYPSIHCTQASLQLMSKIYQHGKTAFTLLGAVLSFKLFDTS